MSFAGKPFVYSVSGEEHVWCSSDVRVLIAGDSNVHRLKSACPPNARIDFMPVSDTKRKAYPKAMPHLRGKEQDDYVPPGSRPRSLGASTDGRPHEAVNVRGTC
ncbi:hypothetical protein DPMN_151734 [Dreissena polymorpha]|uniref:Uncharacterized protein n=1 Tax=Dreissena polymorpha TaxID=45954 RepID=A0A9D4FFM0_DREPO|nr:hypothetical protein DPMN_151734 [Dreissena polymorpha]